MKGDLFILFYSTLISDKEKSTIPRLLLIARPITYFQGSKRFACAVITKLILLVDGSGTTYDFKWLKSLL